MHSSENEADTGDGEEVPQVIANGRYERWIMRVAESIIGSYPDNTFGVVVSTFTPYFGQ